MVTSSVVPAFKNAVDFSLLQKTPESRNLRKADGNLCLGWFDRPFLTIPLNKKNATWFQKWRTKQWTYYSLVSRDFVIGLAVVNTGYVSNAFVTVFDVKERNFLEFEHLTLFKKAAEVSPNSVNGSTRYHSQRIHIDIFHELEEKQSHTLSFSCDDKRGNTLSGQLTLHAEGAPLVNSREVAPGRIVYTHQNSTYRPEGTAVWNGKSIHFNRETDFAAMDFTRGLHSYVTTWNWSCAAGRAKDGTLIAINLASDIGQGSNTVPVFWLDGKIFRTDQAVFSYDHPQKPWTIQTKDGALSLRFHPIGQRIGKINLGLFSSRFTQPIGYYSGTVTPPTEGTRQSYEIDHILGIAEEHFAKW